MSKESLLQVDHLLVHRRIQGCQMVYFQTKNPNLSRFCRVLQKKMLVHFMVICHNVWTFGIFPGYLVYFCPILVRRSKKNLASLDELSNRSASPRKAETRTRGGGRSGGLASDGSLREARLPDHSEN
jgi:hypothetical protein